MSRRERDRLLIAALTAAFVIASGAGRQVTRAVSSRDPLPSWTDDATKRIITSFVGRVTNASGKEFVPAADRIAVFDNDGTLWCEQPMYVELAFSFARVESLVQTHPELRDRQPYKAVIERDTQALAVAGQKGISEIVVATHSGMTTTQFDTTVSRWLATARHPRFLRPYTELAYEPMLELLAYLRANGFRTFVVSGGGADFMRVWAPKIYGLEPDQIIGSAGRVTFELRDGKAELRKLPALDGVDDGPGKPVGIHQYIGQQPIFAFGNSDGDLQMLQYTDEGHSESRPAHPRLMLLLHHDDAIREYAYDRASRIGQLDKALDVAHERGWIVVSLKTDWKTVFKSP